MTPEDLMRRAVALSMEKMQAGSGGPFGAVIARGGEVLAEGWNQVTSAADPTAHAEVVAIRRACQALGRFDLSDCEIYTSCEPCPMCLGAIYWARLRRIWFGNGRADAAAIGFDDDFLYREIPLPLDARSIPTRRLLGDEARAAFEAWRQKPDKVPYDMDAPAPPQPRLRLSGITKRYAAVTANREVSLSIGPGEIHALLGENGAGKSTLVKIIYGVVHPDEGEIAWEGQPVAIADPNAARALGIGMVFQHFSLFESLTVAENIALGLNARESIGELTARIEQIARRYGLAVTPSRHVHHLSVGERQRVEIVRCLLQSPRLLIMDEPTSVLTPQEAEGLFDVLRRLAAEGCSVLYISHKLEEIKALCERATVLRGGRVVAECDPRVASEQDMAEMMIGGQLPVAHRPAPLTEGRAALVVERLTLPADEPFGTNLRDISLTLRAGEILGIAGVAGNGQKELLAVLSGERRAPAAGAVRIVDTPAGLLGPAARRRLGLAFIPEERLGRGAVAEFPLTENALLTAYQSGFVRFGMVRHAAVQHYARDIIARFRVVASGIDAAGSSLSGGNMQKFIVGREVGTHPRVLLAAHPTWGVDIGAALAIRQALMDLAAAGAGVLVVSEDLAELFEISDFIAVLSGGRLSPPRRTRETTVDEVGLLMGGRMATGEAAQAARGVVDAA